MLVITIFRLSQGQGAQYRHYSNLRNLQGHSSHRCLQESRTLLFNKNLRPCWDPLS